MLTKEWWAKNYGGFFLSTFVAVSLYAACAYIKSAVTAEMKNYVPLSVWQQWAQERGEWRGSVDQQLKGLNTELKSQRDENLKELRELTKQVAVQTAILQELRSEFNQHRINNSQEK